MRLVLPPETRVAGRCRPPSFDPSGGAEVPAPEGEGAINNKIIISLFMSLLELPGQKDPMKLDCNLELGSGLDFFFCFLQIMASSCHSLNIEW
jgi:hypothetical protein